MLLFDRDDARAAPDQAMPGCARSWCDPAAYAEIIGLDFGNCCFHYYMAHAKQSGRITLLEFPSWLRSLDNGTLVVCEWAHLAVPQTERSLAQPFTAEQLLGLYQDLRVRGITLKLAPHAHSARMRLWASDRHPDVIESAKKSDQADAASLALFVSGCNDIALARPPVSFARDPRRDFGRAVTARSNRVLNAERTHGYRGLHFPGLMKLAHKVHRKVGGPINLRVAASIVSTLACEDSSRIRLFVYRGRVPGAWFWMRDVLRMSAWHHRGGVARSNIMHHGFRFWVVRYARNRGLVFKDVSGFKKVGVMDGREKVVRTQALSVFRSYLRDARMACIRELELRGVGHMELFDGGDDTDGQERVAIQDLRSPS